MRGKLRTRPLRLGPRRNIPAYAGKTYQGWHRYQITEEHPRVCGENTKGPHFHGAGEGTSPRMRGKRRPHRLGRQGVRNIPAYAGKTLTAAFKSPSRGGTSPRMRGKLSSANCSKSSMGNIPAYAGKTEHANTAGAAAREYPRVCGENPSVTAAA